MPRKQRSKMLNSQHLLDKNTGKNDRHIVLAVYRATPMSNLTTAGWVRLQMQHRDLGVNKALLLPQMQYSDDCIFGLPYGNLIEVSRVDCDTSDTMYVDASIEPLVALRFFAHDKTVPFAVAYVQEHDANSLFEWQKEHAAYHAKCAKSIQDAQRLQNQQNVSKWMQSIRVGESNMIQLYEKAAPLTLEFPAQSSFAVEFGMTQDKEISAQNVQDVTFSTFAMPSVSKMQQSMQTPMFVELFTNLSSNRLFLNSADESEFKLEGPAEFHINCSKVTSNPHLQAWVWITESATEESKEQWQTMFMLEREREIQRGEIEALQTDIKNMPPSIRSGVVPVLFCALGIPQIAQAIAKHVGSDSKLRLEGDAQSDPNNPMRVCRLVLTLPRWTELTMESQAICLKFKDLLSSYEQLDMKHPSAEVFSGILNAHIKRRDKLFSDTLATNFLQQAAYSIPSGSVQFAGAAAETQPSLFDKVVSCIIPKADMEKNMRDCKMYARGTYKTWQIGVDDQENAAPFDTTHLHAFFKIAVGHDKIQKLVAYQLILSTLYALRIVNSEPNSQSSNLSEALDKLTAHVKKIGKSASCEEKTELHGALGTAKSASVQTQCQYAFDTQIEQEVQIKNKKTQKIVAVTNDDSVFDKQKINEVLQRGNGEDMQFCPFRTYAMLQGLNQKFLASDCEDQASLLALQYAMEKYLTKNKIEGRKIIQTVLDTDIFDNIVEKEKRAVIEAVMQVADFTACNIKYLFSLVFAGAPKAGGMSITSILDQLNMQSTNNSVTQSDQQHLAFLLKTNAVSGHACVITMMKTASGVLKKDADISIRQIEPSSMRFIEGTAVIQRCSMLTNQTLAMDSVYLSNVVRLWQWFYASNNLSQSEKSVVYSKLRTSNVQLSAMDALSDVLCILTRQLTMNNIAYHMLHVLTQPEQQNSFYQNIIAASDTVISREKTHDGQFVYGLTPKVESIMNKSVDCLLLKPKLDKANETPIIFARVCDAAENIISLPQLVNLGIERTIEREWFDAIYKSTAYDMTLFAMPMDVSENSDTYAKRLWELTDTMNKTYGAELISCSRVRGTKYMLSIHSSLILDLYAKTLNVAN